MAFALWPHSRPPQPRSYVHSRLPVWATTWPDLSNGELSKTLVKTQSSKYTPDLVYAVELLFPVMLILLLGLSIGVAFHAIKRWRKKREHLERNSLVEQLWQTLCLKESVVRLKDITLRLKGLHEAQRQQRVGEGRRRVECLME